MIREATEADFPEIIELILQLDDSLCVLRHGASTETIKLTLISKFGVSANSKQIKSCLSKIVESGEYRKEKHFSGTYRYIKND